MSNPKDMNPMEKMTATPAKPAPAPPPMDTNVGANHSANETASTKTTSTTTTTARKKSGNTKGLSELARQLRAMQAKNQTLSAEIQRLERQLRILADTSGVSVSDLRGTLQRACESEAYAELQTQLTKLQYQLEEAQLRKAVDFDREAEGKKTANLQLRIGELEESEEALRKEMQQLYQSQDAQVAEAIKLKTLNEQQENEIKALKAQLEEKDKKTKQPTEQSANVNKSPIRKKKKATSSSIGSAVAAPTLEDNQLQLLRKQVAARGKELELKESQYRTRFSLQEERIVDMEQQLSSLYTAFELIDQEHSQEKRSKEALTKALRLADSQVAKAVDHLQRSTTSPNAPNDAASTSPAPGLDDSLVKPNVDYSPASYATTPNSAVKSTVSPASTVASPTGGNEVIVSGAVMKRGRLNRWKKQHASLLRGFATFQLHLSESVPALGHSKKPSIYSLVVFRSSYEVVGSFPNFPFAFRIKVDKYNRNAPEVVLAVKTETELNQWIAGLHEAVNGGGDAAKRPLTSPPVFTPQRMQQPAMVSEAQHFPATDDSALAAALEESLRVSEEESAARATDNLHQGSGISPTNDSDLDAALAESLRVSEQESVLRAARKQRERDLEESKREIGDSESSDADLKAAMAESLLVAQESS